MAKDINKQIAAEISWSRTDDRSARTRPAREAFLKRFEKEVDPDGKLPPDERHRRADHAKRAYMLQLAKRSVAARSASLTSLKNPVPPRLHMPRAPHNVTVDILTRIGFIQGTHDNQVDVNIH